MYIAALIYLTVVGITLEKITAQPPLPHGLLSLGKNLLASLEIFSLYAQGSYFNGPPGATVIKF